MSISRGYWPDSRYTISLFVLHRTDRAVFKPCLCIVSIDFGRENPHVSHAYVTDAFAQVFNTDNLTSRGAVKCFLQKLEYFIDMLLLLYVMNCSTSFLKQPESVI